MESKRAHFDYGFTPSSGPSRGEAARQGREAMEIMTAGSYIAPPRGRVEIRDELASAIAKTMDFRAEETITPFVEQLLS